MTGSSSDSHEAGSREAGAERSIEELIAGRKIVRSVRSASNTVLVLKAPGPGVTVLKLYPANGRFTNELASLRVLADAGVRAPRVITAVDGVVRLEDSSRAWAAELTYVLGRPLDPARDLRSLLEHLREMPRSSDGSIGYPSDGHHDQDGSTVSWVDWLRARVDSYAEAVHHLHAPAVLRVLDQVSSGLANVGVEVPRLVHGDLSTPNVLVDDCGEVTTIDWEHGRWGDPLFDVAVADCRGMFQSPSQALGFARELVNGPPHADVLAVYRDLLHLRELALVEQVADSSLDKIRRRAHRRFGLT